LSGLTHSRGQRIVPHQLHQSRALQFGKRGSPLLIAALLALGFYWLGVRQTEADPVDRHQPPSAKEPLRIGSGNRPKHSPQQLGKDLEGQGLSAFTETAFGHLDSQQTKQMFPKTASPTDRTMKHQPDQ
jgi:hypothetical protein